MTTPDSETPPDQAGSAPPLDRAAAVGRLASGVVHEINNLLTIIQGSAEIIQGLVDEPPPVRRALGDIRRAADHAGRLSRSILALSHRGRGAPARVRVDETLCGLEGVLRRLVGTDVRLYFDLAASHDAVALRLGELEQLLLNLVMNARDAMPGGGDLIVATRPLDGLPARVEAPSPAAHGWLALSVADTGTGMTPRQLGQAFEPYVTTKAPGEGTGLGLPTVRAIVREAGGVIDVDSRPGEGTRFDVLLPRVALQERTPR